jgi:hypothetical protein
VTVADYYVTQGGNDTSGDGSSGNAWRTLNKALTTISIGGGHTVFMGAGTYAENSGSGYPNFNRTFTAPVVVRSLSGARDVIIKAASGTSYDIYISGAAKNYFFEDIEFEGRSGITNGALRIGGGTSLGFTRCKVTFPGRSTLTAVVFMSSVSSATIGDIVFDGCEIVGGSAFAVSGVSVVLNPGSNVLFKNCSITAGTLGGLIGQATRADGLKFEGCTLSSPAGAGLFFGMDTETASGPVTGWIKDSQVTAAAGVGLVVGAGCSNVLVENCVVTGTTDGIRVRENSGAQVVRCQATGGATGAALALRAATGATVENNTLWASAGWCLWVGAGGTGNPSSLLLVQRNTLRGSGSAGLVSWAAAAGESGGSVCDRNILDPAGSQAIGTVRGVSGISTIEGLRAAWAGYVPAGNDELSVMWGEKGRRPGWPMMAGVTVPRVKWGGRL